MKKIILFMMLLILLSSITYGALLDGITSYYLFETNPSVSNLLDTVGTNDSTSDDVKNQSSNCISGGNSWYWDSGSSDNVNMPYSLVHNREALTIAGWFYPDGTIVHLDTLFNGDNAGHGTQIYFRNNPATRFHFTAETEVSCTYDAVLPTADTWHHFAITFDGTAQNMTGYIDGMPVCSIATPHTTAKMDSNFVFGNNPADIYSINGFLCEWGFWDRALTKEEISTLWNSGTGYFYPLFDIPPPNTAPTTPVISSPYSNEINNTRKIEFTSTDIENNETTYRIYINGTLNITTLVNVTVWNGSTGVYNLTMTAEDKQNVSSNSSTLLFIHDITLPIVNIIYPDDNVSNTIIDLNASATDDRATSLTYYWVINGTTNTTTTDANTTFTGSNGYYNLTLFVSDGLQNGSDTTFFHIDTIIPTITMTYPSSNSTVTINVGKIFLNSTFRDNRDLYSYNVTIYRMASELLMFNESSMSLSGISYLFTKELITTDWVNDSYREEIKVCDSHTANFIKKAQVIKKPDKLTYQFGDTIINIKSIGGDEFTSNTKYETSKYSFSFGYAKPTAQKVYEITSNKFIDYLPNSDYKGHFVIGNELWVDFENNFDADVVVENLNGTYRIEVDSDENYILFSSIGGLNCVTEHYTFTLAESIGGYDINLLPTEWFNTDILNVNTTAGVLLFFFLFFIFVALIIFTEYVQIPAFALITGLYGVFLGFLFYVILSAILGVIIIILSIFYIILLIRFK